MRGLLDRLLALRGDFDRSAGPERRRLVGSLGRARWRDARLLSAFHDELLFISAFPDSRANLRAARVVLDRFDRLVADLPPSQRATIDDSGIAGTATSHTFMYGVARWLGSRGEAISFEWGRRRDAERLDSLLRQLLLTAEEDRFDSGEIDTTDWLREAAGRRDPATWLLAGAPDARSTTEGRLWRSLFDETELPLRWSLGGSPRSASRARVAVRTVVRSGFRRPPADPVALIAAPLRGIRRVRGAEAERWHDACLAALVSRTREVFPTVYANPREIVLAPLGEGATLCLLGAAPMDRSALEANYGYVIFSNGIPVGYGGFTSLGAQCNTGANLFESFRGSEAAHLYAQSLRAARTYLDVSCFVVNPYQLGAGNPEAIESGAYWFYDRLGFRPAARAAAALAARERTAIAQDRRHRSTTTTLRALARGDLVLALGGGGTPLISERVLLTSGRLATRALATVPAADRVAWLAERASPLRALCVGVRRTPTAAERVGAMHLVPILAPLQSRIARWRAADRAALWRLVALKGAAQEAGFARAAARLPALWRMLARSDSLAADINT